MTSARVHPFSRLVCGSLFLVASGSSAWSQGFNIDIGDFNTWPVPAATYGAGSGQVGTWSPMMGTGLLTDLNGTMSSVLMTFTDVTISYQADSACTTGDDEALFDDFYYTPDTGGSITFTGLADGDYLFYTYAMATDGPAFITNVDIPISSDPLQGVGGDFCSGFILGVTHAVHHVTVAGAPVVVELTVGANYTSINGMQVVPLANSGTSYCFGDGTGTVCPCGNVGASDEGCSNSTGVGGSLTGSGNADISDDTLRLRASGVVPTQPGLFFQGLNAVNGGSGIVFGDGLRCAGGTVIRLQVVNADASGDAASTVSISASGGVSSGDVRRYQYWYRDPGGSPCGTSFNLTNGLEVTWL